MLLNMEKLNFMGTGSAMVTKCYNTCFTLSKDEEYFLIDAGGGNTILSNLEKSNIKISNIFFRHLNRKTLKLLVFYFA